MAEPKVATSVEDLDPELVQIRNYKARRYACGTEIRNMGEHDLPDDCPVCGARFTKLLDLSGPGGA